MTAKRTAELDLFYRTLRDIADFDRREDPATPYPWAVTRWSVSGVNAEWLADMLGEVARARRAVASVEAHLKARLLGDIRERGDVVLYGTAYYTKKARSDPRWVDKDRSPGDLLGWLLGEYLGEDDTRTAAHLVTETIRIDPRAVRKTALFAEAGRRAGAEGEKEAKDAGWPVWDTFLETEPEPGYILGDIPVHSPRAPKWALSLGHGERRPKREEKHGDTTD